MTARPDTAPQAAATPADRKMQIKHRFTGAVLYEAELSAEVSREPFGIKLGAAIKLAINARADLADAYLARANLARAKEVMGAGQPNGFWAYGYRDKGGALRVKVGCRDKSIAEAREYWSPTHLQWGERQEIPPALDLIEAVARLRDWVER